MVGWWLIHGKCMVNRWWTGGFDYVFNHYLLLAEWLIHGNPIACKQWLKSLHGYLTTTIINKWWFDRLNVWFIVDQWLFDSYCTLLGIPHSFPESLPPQEAIDTLNAYLVFSVPNDDRQWWISMNLVDWLVTNGWSLLAAVVGWLSPGSWFIPTDLALCWYVHVPKRWGWIHPVISRYWNHSYATYTCLYPPIIVFQHLDLDFDIMVVCLNLAGVGVHV